MATPIKRHCILGLIYLNFLATAGFSQNIAKPMIVFKIVNYKQFYNMTDNIILSIENSSDKPLYFTIGEESLKNGYWSSDILDLLAPDPIKS
jgi:hypothetical protein